MNKTVPEGSKLILYKLSKFKIGDIILIKDKHTKNQYLSRLVATGGDSVSIYNQDFYINNHLVEFDNQLKQYYFWFLTDAEVKTLQPTVELKPFNQSNTFISNLTNKEYHALISDSATNYYKKIGTLNQYHNNPYFSVKRFINEVVSEDSLFVLNDNRNNFNDSRYFSLIHKNQIIGKLIYRF